MKGRYFNVIKNKNIVILALGNRPFVSDVMALKNIYYIHITLEK